MARKQKFDPAQAITDELIAHLEKGTLPWRRPWNAPPLQRPLRHTGDPYQGINTVLLTMRGNLAGYTSPYWMTLRQANAEGATVRKGERSSLVVFYGTSYKEAAKADERGDDGEPAGEDDNTGAAIPFLKSYRVFNAQQTEGLPQKFFPEAEPLTEAGDGGIAPIPHMQAFFDAIGARASYGGDRACYIPNLDRIYMPHLHSFESAEAFYATLGHEHVHWSKAPGRLDRDYGRSRFGNTAYAREEVVGELGSLMLGQHLGYALRQLPMSAAYLASWLTVLRGDKRAIFRHAGDAKTACDFLVDLGKKGARDAAA